MPRALRILFAAGMIACGSRPEPSIVVRPPVSPVRTVTVSPSTLMLEPGDSFRFTATVDAEPGVAQTVRWSVDDSTAGTIDSDGTYHAAEAPRVTSAAVVATSDADPSKLGQATVTFPPFDVRPKYSKIFTGETVRFAIPHTTIADVVSWSALNGSMDPDGTYRAPDFAVHDEVTAYCQSCPTRTMKAQVDVWRQTPVLQSISGPAMPGESISISGRFLRYVWVVFPGGGQIPIHIPYPDDAEGSRLTVRVPPHAQSGDLHVEGLGLTEQGPVQSNPLRFERAPQLLVHAQRAVLVPGESTHLDVAWLGAPGPLPLAYEADLGSVDEGGTYLAPPVIDGPAFAHVKACVPGPRDCSSIVLAITPFRISPDDLVVPGGGSVDLTTVGGTGGPAEFALASGGATVSPDGHVIAPVNAKDSGLQFIFARQGTNSATIQMAVTGSGPGLVNRVVDPVDYRLADDPNARLTAASAQAVAVANGRAYVLKHELSLDETSDQYGKIWIDVYDLEDPIRPRWIGAVECPLEASRLFAVQGYLYAAPWWSGGAMAVFDLTGGFPVLIATPVTPFAGGYFSVPVHEGERLIFFDPPMSGQSSFRLRIYEPELDPLNYRSVHLRLPEDAFLDYGTYAVTASGDRAYATYPSWVGMIGPVRLGVWDIAVDPADFLGSVEVGGYAEDLSVAGPLLLAGWRVFDRRGALPIEVAPPPFRLTALAGEGDRYLARDSWSGILYLLDVSDPAKPRISANLDPATPAPQFPASAALTGDIVYAPQGIAGLGIYDVSATGGPLPRQTLTMGMNEGTMMTVAARDGFVYASGYGYVIPNYPEYAFAAWDTSSPQAKARWVHVAPFDVAYALAFAEGNRLLRGGPGKLEVWSIRDPAAPQMLSSTAVDVSCIAVDGNVAWVGTLDGALVAFDLAAASGPVELGRTSVGALPWTAVVVQPGTLALATATRTGGDLVLYDVSLPAQPTILGAAGLGVPSYGVAVTGTTAAVATPLGLGTVDISDPTRPSVYGVFRLPELDPYFGWDYQVTASVVAEHDGLVWVGTLGQGVVYAYDLRQPAWPRVVGHADVRGSLDPYDGVRGFAFDGNLMFVVGALGRLGDADGIEVYEFDILNPRNQLLLSSPAQALMRIVR